MEEQNEILAAMKEGFERIDQRFERIDQRFERIDQRLGRIEGDVSTLKNDMSQVQKDVRLALVKLEFVIDKADLIKENIVDVRARMDRYATDVEHPLDERVTKLEARVTLVEKKK